MPQWTLTRIAPLLAAGASATRQDVEFLQEQAPRVAELIDAVGLLQPAFTPVIQAMISMVQDLFSVGSAIASQVAPAGPSSPIESCVYYPNSAGFHREFVEYHIKGRPPPSQRCNKYWKWHQFQTEGV